MASPPLAPGRLIVWQDNLDQFQVALVVAVELCDERKYCSVTYVQDQRIASMELYDIDKDKSWRVLHDKS